ncbi:MAG: hypothetical protein QNI96_08265 [Woeseiaceae bacterium]|nr:hypothetical protein [Woeseiaceae bacterium]
MYLVDLDKQSVRQPIDWNTVDIDWQGRGADRGLRGIAFDGERVFIAASDELFAYTPDFEKIGSWRNPFLKHCHEIFVWERTLYLTSTGFDTILGFHLDELRFHWAMHVRSKDYQFSGTIFDPLGDNGPLMVNKLHINNVHCSRHGMYLTGLRSGGMLHFNGKEIRMAVELPPGTHNAQPFRDGVLFNDTEADALRYTGRGEGEEDRAMRVPEFDAGQMQNLHMADGKLARPGFARGLCVLSDRVVAGGSSPSTIAIHDLADNRTLGSVNLSLDVRNAIHGLEPWPFD